MVLENLPKFSITHVSGAALSESWQTLDNYKVAGAIIDTNAVEQTVKVKAKRGEDGEPSYIGFRYKPLDGSKYTEVGADGLTLPADSDPVVGVVCAGDLAEGEYDRVSLEITAAGGSVGAVYGFVVQPRYTE